METESHAPVIRNSALDGLRAIAVLMVFAVHTHLTSIPGGLGVDIFFVLSGFLITRLLLQQYSKNGRLDLVSFYTHRFTRLVPALVSMCLVTVAGYAVIKGGFQPDKALFGLFAVTYVSNVYMTLTGFMTDPFSHTWSLAQEEQFYLIWPLALVLILGRGLRFRNIGFLSLGLAILSSLAWFLFGSVTPFNPLLKFGGMLAGAAAALLTGTRPWQSARLAYISVAIFGAAFIAETYGLIGRSITSPLTSLCFTFIVLSLAYSETVMSRLLSLGPLVYLGRISYGFYLWHYPILILAFNAHLAPWQLVIGTFMTTLAVSAASFHFLEQPIIRRRDSLATWVRARLVSRDESGAA